LIFPYFGIVCALGIFFIPYKKPYLNETGHASFIELLIEWYKFEEKIGDYEAKYDVAGIKEAGSELNFGGMFRRAEERTNRKTKAKDVKSLLEYYSWLGVPENIRAKMIVLNRSLLIKEIIAVTVIGVLVFISCCLRLMNLNRKGTRK